ncbi:phosphate acetyltransferase [Aliiroseovarius crassostreae]|uniref:Phosphate acetyltransferase n=1 Tax=Aliiroseovarius crassostreae TaxID=154981 RepID=A0A0P7KIW5_9RHOB|nr:phosphate acetyltransferase [Aliiroseovarius crassostreae]KPN63546.1 phosphate acetyltransferase [Aliiroseovarius crassostreae]SFU91897.1 phosphate acetyltransferase [Aliiroseovarius crassostreae]
MKPLEMLLKNAARSQKKIVLSEGADPRAVAAAIEARAQGIARIVLVGPKAAVQAELARAGATSGDGIDIQDPATSPLLDDLAALYHKLRQHKGVTPDMAREAAQSPYVFAALMVKSGHADGTVGGAVATTAEIVRTAIQVIGPKPGSKLISSFFLMLFCKEHHTKKGAHIFTDSGLIIDPSAEEMAQIAQASAKSFVALTGDTPRVAMLSFSTRGSASHDKVSKVVKATELARAANPDLLIDGELQFDAAFVPDVAASKASGSPLGGDANIFVFPNLEAGNIAYKIAQRVGGAAAIGPILQGLARPANDLSRGCSAEDILHMIAVTAAQADAADILKAEGEDV